MSQTIKAVQYEYSGLTDEQVSSLKEKYGANALPEKKPPTAFQIFMSQLASPLVYILLFAALVTFVMHEYSDAVIIMIAVLINTVLGFVQEERAGKSLAALKKLLHSEAQVIRNGNILSIDTRELVPGDVVILKQGDKVAADGEVLESTRLYVQEAILTGESVPIEKDKKAQVFMGTVVSSGRGLMRVIRTGSDTEMGKIASSIQGASEETPLRKQLAKFSKDLTYIVAAMIFIVFSIGLILDMDPVEIFKTAVALAVLSIPEGLLVALTAILAIGMQRVLKRKGLVRNLASAETLGGVTTICTDKTGTLTLGQMQVISHYGHLDKLKIQAIVANDLDDPLVIAAHEWGSSQVHSADDLLRTYHRLDSVPFSSEERFFASLNNFDAGSNILFVNGAPEFLIEWSDLTKKQKEEQRKLLEQLSKEGKRVVGYAQKVVDKKTTKIKTKDIKKHLEFVGILAFSDPVRTDVKDSLEKARTAGIDLIIITGDYAQTALAVLEELGMNVKEEYIKLGDELEDMSMDYLKAWLAEDAPVKLLARTKPQDKMKVISALKENNEVVAMMGDGVNDAPALAKADIGIVVGEATDVAKETADLVLLDSSFATVVAAIEEGRGIWDNIRKIVLYLMADAFQGILAILLALFTRNPLPVTASQILWINIVSDGFPNLALTMEPKASNTMRIPPRSPKERLVAPWVRNLIGLVSIAGGIMAFVNFLYSYYMTGSIDVARSVAFATLGVNSLIYVFSIKNLHVPFWKENLFNNKWLNIAVIAGFMFQFTPFLFPSIGKFFYVVPIGNYWFMVFAASSMMFSVIEISKWFLRHHLISDNK
jgi:Ca2+-transporting ATPase